MSPLQANYSIISFFCCFFSLNYRSFNVKLSAMTIRAYWVSLSYFDQQLLPYLAPDHTPLGVRVEVPFGNKTCMGIGICWGDCDLASAKLKPIIAVDDQVLLYTEHMKHLAHCIRQYYHSP